MLIADYFLLAIPHCLSVLLHVRGAPSIFQSRWQPLQSYVWKNVRAHSGISECVGGELLMGDYALSSFYMSTKMRQNYENRSFLWWDTRMRTASSALATARDASRRLGADRRTGSPSELPYGLGAVWASKRHEGGTMCVTTCDHPHRGLFQTINIER